MLLLLLLFLRLWLCCRLLRRNARPGLRRNPRRKIYETSPTPSHSSSERVDYSGTDGDEAGSEAPEEPSVESGHDELEVIGEDSGESVEDPGRELELSQGEKGKGFPDIPFSPADVTSVPSGEVVSSLPPVGDVPEYVSLVVELHAFVREGLLYRGQPLLVDASDGREYVNAEYPRLFELIPQSPADAGFSSWWGYCQVARMVMSFGFDCSLDVVARVEGRISDLEKCGFDMRHWAARLRRIRDGAEARRRIAERVKSL